MSYIGISEDRLHHIIGVARKAYQIAKEIGYDEYFCRRCFMLGWIHDVGYEFSEKPSEHPDISAKMLLCINENNAFSDLQDYFYKAIKEHGKYPTAVTDEYRILSMADMLIDSKGHEVSAIQRLNEIRKRYGDRSTQYLVACEICYRIGLTTSANPARSAP